MGHWGGAPCWGRYDVAPPPGALGTRTGSGVWGALAAGDVLPLVKLGF